ncbi:MAG: hypothetical protein IPJ98_28335 [Bryobacterales bacterium]|nr:hypothetical protein [Bryobacterales bacterium]
MIAALNVAIGALGRSWNRRTPRACGSTPDAPYPDRVPDHSLTLLVHEASSAGIVTPEALPRRKLAAKGTLVRLSAFLPEALGPNDVLIPRRRFSKAPQTPWSA